MIMLTLSIPTLLKSAKIMTTLGDHVAHIISLSPNREMGRIAAWRIIALVQNFHPFGDGAAVEFIAKPMRQDQNMFTVIQHPISPVIGGACPLPAIIISGSGNFFPKALFNRALGGIVPPNKSGRLASDVTESGVCSSCNWGRLTTAAFAELRKLKFKLGELWGILRHVDTFLSRFGQAGDVRSVARRCYWCVTGVIVTQKG